MHHTTRQVSVIFYEFLLINITKQTVLETYILYTELAYGVVHQDSEIFYSHPHIPIGPTALIWPVLETFVLWRQDNYDVNRYVKEKHSMKDFAG